MSPFYVRPKPGELEFLDDEEYHFAMRQARSIGLRGAIFATAGVGLAATSHSWLQVAASIVMIVVGLFFLAATAAQAYLGYRWRKRSSPGRPAKRPAHRASIYSYFTPSVALSALLVLVLIVKVVVHSSTLDWVLWVLWVAGLVLASAIGVVGWRQRHHGSTSGESELPGSRTES